MSTPDNGQYADPFAGLPQVSLSSDGFFLLETFD